MKTWPAEELHRVWRVQLGIYQAFADICERNGLRYYAGFGSALGAIRHGGFIPWDDDMDLCMPREDYETFLQLAPAQLPPELELQHIGVTEGFVLPFAKICDRRTTFIEETDTNRRYHSGIFVDLFAQDAAPDGEAERKKQYRQCWRWARMCSLAEYGRAKLPEGLNPVIRLGARGACWMLHGIFRLFHLTPAFFYRRYLRAARAYEGEKIRTWVSLGDMSVDPDYDPADVLYPTRPVPFEDIQIRVPGKTEEYLTILYGDFMTLPPEEKRWNHYPAVLKFAEDAEAKE